eukprot:GHVR01170853.1.p1 GENE.GHVR01170853.1~~GHVR01170853.1.p1  ORF type:complete len:211 (-),score=55.93 GHVR01170853.1:319-951(-)
MNDIEGLISLDESIEDVLCLDEGTVTGGVLCLDQGTVTGGVLCLDQGDRGHMDDWGVINLGDGSTSLNPSFRLPRSERKKQHREHYRMKRKEGRGVAQQMQRQRVQKLREEGVISIETKEQRDQRETEEQTFLEHAHASGSPVVINCAFNDKMDKRDVSSLLTQLVLGYNHMKKKRVPVCVCVCMCFCVCGCNTYYINVIHTYYINVFYK